MKSDTPPPVLRWLDAVGQAPFKVAEKAVLFALVRWVKWEVGATSECWPSMERIARYAGLTIRGTQGVIARLESRGVLRVLSRSRGGVSKQGRGITHRYRLELAALEALIPERRSGLNPEPGASDPGTPSTESLNATTPNPAQRSGEHPEEPPRELPQATTTKTRGGGGDALETENTRPSPDQALSERLLIDFDVMNGTAARLARDHTPDEVRAVIEWVKRQNGVKSRSGLLVRALEDGTAARLAHRAREARDRVDRQRAEENRRRRFAAQLERLLGWGDQNRPEDMGLIDQAWPGRGRGALGRGEAVTDIDLDQVYVGETVGPAAAGKLIGRLADLARQTVTDRETRKALRQAARRGEPPKDARA